MFKNGISVGTFLFLLLVGVMACLVITAVLFPTELVRNMFGAQSASPTRDLVRIDTLPADYQPPAPLPPSAETLARQEVSRNLVGTGFRWLAIAGGIAFIALLALRSAGIIPEENKRR
jgi:hypothetical protein